MSYLAVLKNPQKIGGSGSRSGSLPKLDEFFLPCPKIHLW